MADYSISLDNGYRIDRISAHKIEIYGDEVVNDGKENVHNYLYVPTEVTEVWWDNHYIIAKQLKLIMNERGFDDHPKNPSEEDYSYWIIEIDKNEVKGPLTLKQLEYDTNLLGVNVEFTPIEKLKKNQNESK